MLSLVAGTIILPEIILRSTISIASNLVISINYLTSISHADLELQNMLITSDIIEDINIIKNYIEENQSNNNSNSVNLCINNLNRTLSELELNIKNITRKIEEHKELWFGFLRSYNISEEKKNIPILINQFKHRFEILIKISKSLD